LDQHEVIQLRRLADEFLSVQSGEQPFVITPESAQIMIHAVAQLLQQVAPERHEQVLAHLADNARRVRNGFVERANRDGVVAQRDFGPVAMLTERDGGEVSVMDSLNPGSW